MNPKLKSRLLIFFIAVFLGLLLVWTTRTGKAPAGTGDSTLLNARLPDPRLPKDSWLSKMDFYKQAEKDSSRFVGIGGTVDSGEVKVFRSLAKLQERAAPTVQTQPAPLPVAPGPQQRAAALLPPAVFTPPTLPPHPVAPPDPELQQLDTLLDKVLAIQRASPPGVNKTPVADKSPDTIPAIPAVTETGCTLTSGATLAFRTSAEARWHGLLIPRNTLLYGTATLEGERLHVRIKSIRMGDLLCSVSLEAYDQDGIEGIYIPGAPAKDEAQAGADGLVNGLNTGGGYGTAAGQAAGAGIQTLKSLFSKKMREVRVTVRENYAVWLK